jgi:hypothetical protein
LLIPQIIITFFITHNQVVSALRDPRDDLEIGFKVAGLEAVHAHLLVLFNVPSEYIKLEGLL